MNRRRAILILISTLLLLAYSHPSASANPTARLSDLSHLDLSNFNNTPPVELPIRVFEARVKKNPTDAVSFAMLGDLYARQARETGDATGYLRAQTALEQALKIVPGYSVAGAALASAYYSQHEFTQALALAKQVYQRDPRNTRALAVIGDAELALGNYSGAEASYQELSSGGETPPVLAREAGLDEVKGQPTQALERVQRAAAEALSSGGTQESVAWYFIRLGDISFNMGNLQDARSYYASALKIFKDYHLALAGLGKVSAAEGKYDDAIAYYQHAVDIIPQPDYIAALGDLYALTGQPERAEAQYKTVEYIGKLSALNKQIYNRQLANFYSDHDRHADDALRLALAELAIRKDVLGYDAAAWAYYKNGDPAHAQSMMKMAMAQGTQDARLYFHAGMIAYRLNEPDRARDYLAQALSLNPHFSLLYAEEARRTLERAQAQGGK